MGRAPCCDKANVKRGPWSPDEDIKLKEFIEKYGTGGNWIALPQKAGLKRCGKSCRLRWLNYLRPNIRHGHFSDDEDRIICTLFATIGSRWSIIAAQLPGRTDNDIKNYWNTKLKKKLLGISPAQTRTNHQFMHSNIYIDPASESLLPNNDYFPTTFSQEILMNYSLPVSDNASSFCQEQYLINNHYNNIDVNITAQSCSSSEISSYGKDLEYFESYLNNGVDENQQENKNILEYDYEDVNKLISPANYVEGFNSSCPTEYYI